MPARALLRTFRMQVVSLVLRRLVFFHLDAVGVGVLANARHLPGNFHVRTGPALTRQRTLFQCTEGAFNDDSRCGWAVCGFGTSPGATVRGGATAGRASLGLACLAALRSRIFSGEGSFVWSSKRMFS